MDMEYWGGMDLSKVNIKSIKINTKLILMIIVSILLFIKLKYVISNVDNSTGLGAFGFLKIDTNGSVASIILNNDILIITFILILLLYGNRMINSLALSYTYEFIRNKSRRKYYIKYILQTFKFVLIIVFIPFLYSLIMGQVAIDKNLLISINLWEFFVLGMLVYGMIYVFGRDINLSYFLSILSIIIYIFITKVFTYLNIVYIGVDALLIALLIKVILILIVVSITYVKYSRSDFLNEVR